MARSGDRLTIWSRSASANPLRIRRTRTRADSPGSAPSTKSTSPSCRATPRPPNAKSSTLRTSSVPGLSSMVLVLLAGPALAGVARRVESQNSEARDAGTAVSGADQVIERLSRRRQISINGARDGRSGGDTGRGREEIRPEACSEKIVADREGSRSRGCRPSDSGPVAERQIHRLGRGRPGRQIRVVAIAGAAADITDRRAVTLNRLVRIPDAVSVLIQEEGGKTRTTEGAVAPAARHRRSVEPAPDQKLIPGPDR